MREAGPHWPKPVVWGGLVEGDRADAGHLGGYDVHQHARDQRRHASGDVEADPVDRDHPLR